MKMMKIFLSILVLAVIIAAGDYLKPNKAKAVCTPTVLTTTAAISDTGFAWIVPNNFGTPADHPSAPSQSILRFFENGVELGPAHSLHADIRSIGLGRFSHWSAVDGSNEQIHFSASDNSDPRTNGRVYTYCADASPPGPPTCTAALPDGDWTIATSGTRYTYVTGVSPASTEVKFFVWTDSMGGSDWNDYAATDEGGGRWGVNLNIGAPHTGFGNVNVQPIMLHPGLGWTWCADTANFTRLETGTIEVTSNLPTTWGITCTLTNPVCPNVPAGSNTSPIPGKPYSTWTITPANIAGYDWQVVGCALNVPCTKTLP